jgi:hypothetical protein
MKRRVEMRWQGAGSKEEDWARGLCPLQHPLTKKERRERSKTIKKGVTSWNIIIRY